MSANTNFAYYTKQLTYYTKAGIGYSIAKMNFIF